MKQAAKKKILPKKDQKSPMLAIRKPKADMIKKIHPIKLIFLLFIKEPQFNRVSV